MGDYSVRGRSFRTDLEYQAALRDEKKIDFILKKYDNADLKGKEHIINVLNRGEIKFETMVGEDFCYELEEKHNGKLKKIIITDADIEEKETRKKTVEEENTRKKAAREKAAKEKAEKKAAAKKKAAEEKAAKKKAAAKKTLEKQQAKNKKLAAKMNVGQSRSSQTSSKTSLTKVSLSDYDEQMQKQIMIELYLQEQKRKRIVFICSVVAILCMGYVFFYYYLYEKNSNEYEHLASLKVEESDNNQVHINYTKEEKKELVVLEKYKKLFSQNKSLIGWIKIDDTNIDYPVMQTVNNEYYLDHNYNQEYDKNGSIFLDKDCDITNPGTNMIIYGHHMGSGRMFGGLKLYSNKQYYDKHPIIQFDTIYEEGRYQIMYVFRSRIYNEDEIVFKYYQFFEASTPEMFDSYMNEMANLALYDTGVRATYGDRLITLSTCDYNEKDGRFVVVAKKIN